MAAAFILSAEMSIWKRSNGPQSLKHLLNINDHLSLHGESADLWSRHVLIGIVIIEQFWKN